MAGHKASTADKEDYEGESDSEEAQGFDSRQPAKRKAPKGSSVDIHDPMFLWIFLLVVAVALRIVLASTSYIPLDSQFYALGTEISNFLLQFPGIVILPLIIGAIIGAEVGSRSSTLARSLKNGLTNGIYASIIYVITIVIIFIVLNSVTPQFTTIYLTLLNSILLPVVVFLLVLEIFAALSFWRKVDA